ncbi:putative transmembrane protein [Gregarina niphandrodes]|uniref:Transmembrane protein n=1 Tax=Gregarina niphandrodes TaxID=110365 RepID=A0A023AXF8_GRENI|nr:putative transmembrane protein [Gregarina niphandrodes]EZG43138.1 putative transmembrane protein [Gregarina niphandrodes]|eukprot:XP_011133605.1 putative transmembrane protein [Gregarina niphandrodes]
MRTFKGEASGMPGSELLSVLIRPDGSQTKLDNCVAQVVTMRAGGGGEVTALVLAPKTVFETELEPVGERTPSALETTMVEGENYDWFEQWDRMMVWRPKEGPPSDAHAEAGLLDALRRRLEHRGPRNKPEAVGTLCREIFGDHLRDLRAFLNRIGDSTPLDEVDDVTVSVMRPIDPSELAELLARVPKNWMPVLQRSVEWKTAGWKTAGWADGGDLETGRVRRKTKQRLYKTGCVLGVGAAVLFLGSVLWRSSKSAQGELGPAVPGTYAQLTGNEDREDWPTVWRGDQNVPVAPCGSGTLRCDAGCGANNPRRIAFGQPWPITFPLAWEVAHASPYASGKCRVHCNTFDESKIALDTRLLTRFPMQTRFNTTMSREEQVTQILNALSTKACQGANEASRDASELGCVCDFALVECDVTVKPKDSRWLPRDEREIHKVVLTDMEAPIARLAASLGDYPVDTYDVSLCNHVCLNLSSDARKTVEANKAAEAAYLATLTTTTKRPKVRQEEELMDNEFGDIIDHKFLHFG